MVGGYLVLVNYHLLLPNIFFQQPPHRYFSAQNIDEIDYSV